MTFGAYFIRHTLLIKTNRKAIYFFLIISILLLDFDDH